MTHKRVFMFVGTTAELIKLVPVIRELNRRKIVFTIIASGQNDIHFEEFASDIGKPEIIYAVTPKGGGSSLLGFSLWAIRSFISLIVGLRNYFVGLHNGNTILIVHGDTVSSLMGALLARYYHVKLVHIESGLRSFNFLEPFPEEICRYFISSLVDIHFCPNKWAIKNLDNVSGEKINTHQNTLIESFWLVIKRKCQHQFVRQLKNQKSKYFVLVTHRQEHVLFGKKKTTNMLLYILSHLPKDLQCIFLVHDLSVDFIHALGQVIPGEITQRMIRIERLPYADFMHLLSGAEFAITDGGSNQEELYYLGKPCLLLRNKTERIEGLSTNVVLSNYDRNITLKFIKNYNKYKRRPINIGNRPSEIIVNSLFPRL